MAEPIPLRRRIYQLIREKGITTSQFEAETGIGRRILYENRKTQWSTLMGLAYYFGITVEELVAGTTMEERWEERLI